MKNRRQFLIDNVAAWFLAPELAKRIEWVANHEGKPYITPVSKPKHIIYAFDTAPYRLTLDVSLRDDSPKHLTWAEWAGREGVDAYDKKSFGEFLDHVDLDGLKIGRIKPTGLIPGHLQCHYEEWSWALHDSATSRAYDYLERLDLGPSKPTKDDPLGYLDLTQGPHLGSNATYAVAHCEKTLSCLQHRLLEIGEDVEIVIT